MSLKVIQQQVILDYDRKSAVPGAALAFAREGDQSHLRVNELMSQQAARTMLESSTRSTIAEVREARAVLRTQFFGDDYPKLENHSIRGTYTMDKATRLVDILIGSGAALRFVGIVSTARVSIRGERARAHLGTLLQKHFGKVAALALGGPIYDFTLRASKELDDDRYGALQLSWYQTRSMQFATGQGADFEIRDWEMELDDEGLEVRFDQNNKKALYAGKRDWHRDDALGVIEKHSADFHAALGGLPQDLISDDGLR